MTQNRPDPRYESVIVWLQARAERFSLDMANLEPASSDASFRRYFRVPAKTGTLIVMDAPPPQEDCRPFVDVDQRLLAAGLNVPRILDQDLAQGFLLLTDLGPSTYFSRISQGLDDALLQRIYRDALAALVRMQQADANGLPAYDAARLTQELGLFPEWYVQVHHQTQLTEEEKHALERVFAMLVAHNAAQPSVLVHRDFHSPNLMLCEQPAHGPNPGILDFQDALAGPISYDLASLVMDARTTWEEPQQLDWAIRYWEMAKRAGLAVPTDFADFHRDYEWMGLQRNMRILGVFARLNHRDGKPSYLDHVPRVKQYVRQVAGRYGVFAPLIRLLDRLEGIERRSGLTF